MKGFQIQQKGERRISAALRIMLVVVLLAVQIGFVVAISYFMQEYLALALRRRTGRRAVPCGAYLQ